MWLAGGGRGGGEEVGGVGIRVGREGVREGGEGIEVKGRGGVECTGVEKRRKSRG